MAIYDKSFSNLQSSSRKDIKVLTDYAEETYENLKLDYAQLVEKLSQAESEIKKLRSKLKEKVNISFVTDFKLYIYIAISNH